MIDGDDRVEVITGGNFLFCFDFGVGNGIPLDMYY